MKQGKKIRKAGERQLKVYEKYILKSYHQYVVLPEIRLCGKWLKAIGFDCGQLVTVQHEKNKIIITVDNEAKTDK